MISLQAALFLLAFLMLAKAGAWLVGSLVRIGRYLGWSEFIVAFVLLAFAVSVPEFFVGISSALHGRPEISFGNIVGANVINFTLTLGLPVLMLAGLAVERKIVHRDAVFALSAASAPLVLILDGSLSRLDGIILLAAFGFYITWLFSQRERFTKALNKAPTAWEGFKGFLKDAGLFALGVAMLIVGAEIIIRSVLFFVGLFGVSPALISIVLVGAGTALPEVYFAYRAARAGRAGMIMGNAMGAVVVTSLFVLGVVSVISPVVIDDFRPYAGARLFLVAAAVLFIIFVRTKESISRKEALALISLYLVFVISQVFLIE